MYKNENFYPCAWNVYISLCIYPPRQWSPHTAQHVCRDRLPRHLVAILDLFVGVIGKEKEVEKKRKRKEENETNETKMKGRSGKQRKVKTGK